MIVIGLDQKFYKNWPENGHEEAKESKKKKSQLHKDVFNFLREEYPTDTILQEIPLFGTNPWPLKFDFYLPIRRIACEAHGRQHFERVPHFHKNLLEFRQAQVRDQKKREWCEINNITLLELPYNENQDEWRDRIRKARKSK